MGTRRIGLRRCPGTWTGPESYPRIKMSSPLNQFIGAAGCLFARTFRNAHGLSDRSLLIQFFWGNSHFRAGATQDRMCRNPTGSRVPESLSRWRSDEAPPFGSCCHGRMSCRLFRFLGIRLRSIPQSPKFVLFRNPAVQQTPYFDSDCLYLPYRLVGTAMSRGSVRGFS